MNAWALSNEESIETGYNYKVVIDYSDLVATASTTATVALTDVLPIGAKVERCAARVATAFTGTTTAVLEVGDGGDVDRNLVSFDMMSTAGTWKVAVPSTTPSVFNTADTVDATFTGGANFTNITAGKVEIYLKIADLSKVIGGSATGGDAQK